MLKVVLARHAETIWNEQLRYIGRTDLDLSALGRKNAKLLATHLEDIRFDAIYSSGMKRSIQTAEAVAGPLGLNVQPEALLDEIDFGYWEGLTHEEIASAYPGIVEQWMGDPFTVDIPGGEPWPTFAKRVRRGWEKIVSQIRPHNILIVTHAGCIKAILGQILNINSDLWWQIYQDKGALNHIIVDQGSPRILRINDTDYRRVPDSAELPRPFKIRRCDLGEATKIQFVINKSAVAYQAIMEPGFDAGDYMPLEQLQAEMSRMTFYAVDNGGILVGVMAYEPLNGLALVRHAYVLPACQRLGFGGHLLDHIESKAIKDGYTQLLVGTYADNAWAIDFYAKHGFKLTADPQALLARYWEIPQCQAVRSLVLEKDLAATDEIA